jgi:hypothetical protein
LGTLSEPRRKQNLYANPKRTAKSSTSLSQTHLVRKRFKLFFKNHFALLAPPTARTAARFN